MPEASPLALLRRSVDRKSHKLKAVLMDARIRKEIFGGIANDEKKAVKAFVGQNQENALKSRPKVSRHLLLDMVSFQECTTAAPSDHWLKASPSSCQPSCWLTCKRHCVSVKVMACLEAKLV